MRTNIPSAVLVAVLEAAIEYHDHIAESPLAPNSRTTYNDGAFQFVRWLAGDFAPGRESNKRSDVNTVEHLRSLIRKLEGNPS